MGEKFEPVTNSQAIIYYVLGFILSLALTLAAYFAVGLKVFETSALVAAAITLAVTQLFVQLVFFLHITAESRPRWRLITLSFAAIVLVIIVFGSLWIMQNLDYHMLHGIDQKIMEEERIYR